MLEEIQNLDLRELLREAKSEECYQAYLKFLKIESEVFGYSCFLDVQNLKSREQFMETMVTRMRQIAQTEEEKKLAEDYNKLYILLLYQRTKLHKILKQVDIENSNKVNLYKDIIFQLYDGSFEKFKDVANFTISVLERLFEFGKNSRLSSQVKGNLEFEKNYYGILGKFVFDGDVFNRKL